MGGNSAAPEKQNRTLIFKDSDAAKQCRIILPKLTITH
jgi:hypothetical protein